MGIEIKIVLINLIMFVTGIILIKISDDAEPSNFIKLSLVALVVSTYAVMVISLITYIVRL